MQHTYTQLQKYCHDKHLTINTKKTKILYIKSTQFENKQVRIISHSNECLHNRQETCSCSDELENVEEYLYLGITIDNRFKFDSHIQKLCTKLRTVLYYFYRIFPYLNVKTLKMIYTALAESRVRYGIQAWANTSKTHVEKVENLQNRILKVIHRKLDNTTRITAEQEKYKYFKKLDLLPASKLYRYTIIIKNYFNDEHKHKINHPTSTRLVTRQQLKVPSFTNENGKRTLKYIIPVIFNQLPDSVKQLNSFKEIKREIKKWSLQNDEEH